MEIYLSLLTLSWLGNKLFSKKIYFFLLYTLMAIVAGTRDINTGVDTAMYHRIFNYFYGQSITFEYFSDLYVVEIGNRFLISIASIFSSDPQSYLFLTAVITTFFMGMFIYRNTSNRNYWLASFFLIALGPYFFEFNGIRQTLGIAIAANSLEFLYRKSYIKAMLFVLVGSLFHVSIFIMIPFILVIRYFIKKIEKGSSVKKIYLQCFVGLSIFALMIPFLINVFLSLDDKFAPYAAVIGVGVGTIFNATGMKMVAIAALVVYTILFSDPTMQKKFFPITFYTMIALFLYVLQVSYMDMLFRVEMIFDIYICLFLTFFVYEIKNIEIKTFIFLLVILGGYFSTYYSLFNGFQGIFQRV